jgi:hypothetical protein
LDCSTTASSIGVSDKYAREDHVHKYTPAALPVATSTVLGGVKGGGSNITIADDGVISSVIPIASGTVLGGVKSGTNISINASGVISASVPSASTATPSDISTTTSSMGSSTSYARADHKHKYTPAALPVATSTTLGGVKGGGSNITIADDGVISATVPPAALVSPPDISTSSSSRGTISRYAREDHWHKFEQYPVNSIILHDNDIVSTPDLLYGYGNWNNLGTITSSTGKVFYIWRRDS